MAENTGIENIQHDDLEDEALDRVECSKLCCCQGGGSGPPISPNMP